MSELKLCRNCVKSKRPPLFSISDAVILCQHPLVMSVDADILGGLKNGVNAVFERQFGSQCGMEGKLFCKRPEGYP